MSSLRLLLVPMLLAAVAVPALAADSDPVTEHRLAVRFSRVPDGLTEHGRFHGADILAVDQALGFVVVSTSDEHGFRGRAAQDASVRSVEDDSVQKMVAFASNDPLYSTQYGPALVGAPAARDLATSAAPAICVLDTGVRMTHQDLAASYAGGIDLVNGDSDPSDDHGHGTHVAGIAAAIANNAVGVVGIAPSPLLAVKVLDANGDGSMSTVASGIRWCVDNGAKVISMSLGGTAGSAVAQDAVDYAWSHGVVLAAAAGNGNSCVDCVSYPAKYANTIAVGCVDQYKAFCSFASTGPEVDLAAPGNAIQSTWWTGDAAYQRAGGTSMSTPHVAGAAALVWAAHPDWSNAQVRQALESSAQDVATAGKDAKTGFGLVRADLAIAQSPSAPAPPPAPAPAPSAGVALSPASQSKSVVKGGSVAYTFQVQNTGSANDTVAVSLSGLKSGWSASLSASSLSLAPGATASVTLTVTAPAKPGSMSLAITAASGLDPMVKASGSAQTTATK